MERIYRIVRSVISPMLANVALTELDELCRGLCRTWASNGNTPLVRYADDFIIVCDTKEKAQRCKEELSIWLKREVVLELSLEKTSITHVTGGKEK
jgi:RNA-directed DNA polymerase